MKRLLILGVISATLMTISIAWASSNLNSSRSNTFRVVWANDIGLSQAQATAMLAELDKLGPADEAKLKTWLANNFKRFGVDDSRVKKLSIFLEQQISCNSGKDSCKGKYSKGAKGDCFCFGPVVGSDRVRMVNKTTPIVIFLLSDPEQEGAAFSIALNSSRSNQ